MHLILGNGNLGRSLANQLAQRSLTYKLLDKFQFCYPQNTILKEKPTHVWCCVGRGSIEQAKQDFNSVLSAHLQLPVHLMSTLGPNVKLTFFSSDYVADERKPLAPYESRPKSLYALSKMFLEQTVLYTNRPNTCVVRVGSLYGHYFPERTFPGKIRAQFERRGVITLPMNKVTPTPTEWLAECLLDPRTEDQMFRGISVVKHCAPDGNVTLADWGRKILGTEFQVYASGYDEERPKWSELNCSFFPPDNWERLWEKYKI